MIKTASDDVIPLKGVETIHLIFRSDEKAEQVTLDEVLVVPR